MNIDEIIDNLRPSISFSATNVRFICDEPNSPDRLWEADLIACGCDFQNKVFEKVLFIESGNQESGALAALLGIEFEDGLPVGLRKDLALKQQSFIHFLREETRLNLESRGLIAQLFSGNEYSAEGRATEAYIAAREVPLWMGIGYKDGSGEYRRVSVDPEDW